MRIGIAPIKLLLAASLLLPLSSTFAQTGPPPIAAPQQVKLSDALLDRISPDLRDVVKALLPIPEKEQQRLLTLSDNDLRGQIIAFLSFSPPEGTNFVIQLLEKDPTLVPAKWLPLLIRSMRGDRHWRSNPYATLRIGLLEKLVATAEINSALEAIDCLRGIRMDEIGALLDERFKFAKDGEQQPVIKKLAEEQERWISLRQGTMLPSFLRLVPPVFTIKPADRSIRIVAFGDFGTGSDEQRQVAATIAKYQKKAKFDFGLTLGDNFYNLGMESPSDPRWQTRWEQLYGPLGIKFYATLGNHDWGLSDSPAAEILYSDKSASWRMPSPYYTFTAGTVQFFALDTNAVSEAQLIWLRGELEKSQAQWKVVYGHHHIYSATRGDNVGLIERLLPLIKGRVDVYLNGHDHNLQHLKPEGGTHFFISGGGGAGFYPTKPYDRSLFKYDGYGFAVLEADSKQMKIRFVDKEGKQLYEYTLNQ